MGTTDCRRPGHQGSPHDDIPILHIGTSVHGNLSDDEAPLDSGPVSPEILQVEAV